MASTMDKGDLDGLKWQYIDQPECDGKKRSSFFKVPFIESIFYHSFYMIGAGYSLYQFFLGSQILRGSLPLTNRYNSVFGPYQDQMDWEWTVFSPVIIECLPYGFIHLVLAQLIRKFIPELLTTFYVFFSTIMLLKILGTAGTCICFTVIIVMSLVLSTRVKSLIWVTWCLILVALNTRQFTEYLGIWLSDITDGEYKTSVIVAWIILRSLSFSLEICEDDPRREKPTSILFMTSLAYSLYFPLVVTGPYMPYTDFQKGLQKTYEPWTVWRLGSFFCRILRFLFWMGIADILLNYFYAHALHNSPNYISRMNSWAMAGFVYFLLIFFFLKYVVYYGLPATFAKYEGYEPPRHPRCVLIVYRFSDVWRYFDYGLYRFMIKHIYLPFLKEERGLLRQLEASVIVFTFIYVWHGVSNAIFWWALINFCGVVVEKIFDKIRRGTCYIEFQKRWFPRAGDRYVQCILFATLLLMSVTSLVIFLSSLENAQVVLWHIFFKGFPNVTITTLFFFYCIAQCGIDLETWRSRHKQDKVN